MMPPIPPPTCGMTSPGSPGWWPASTSRPPPTRPPRWVILVSTDSNEFEDEVASELTFGMVRNALDRLTDLQRAVIRNRFGFDGSDPASLQTTAERLGVGVRKVRQAEAEALGILADSEALEAAPEAA